jgi:uncharacterized membrane protein
MNSKTSMVRLNEMLLLFLSLQILMNVTVYFDIPTIRQVFGFVYLTFLPGFIFIKILKMDMDQDKSVTFLFSAGLSIAILMILGLLTNQIAEPLNINKPLSSFSLVVVLNVYVLLGICLAYLRNNNLELFNLKESIAHISFIFLTVLPFISIIGTMYVSIFHNNKILLLLLLLISLTFVAAVLNNKIVPLRAYTFAITMVAISLLMHSALISEYIIPFGSDVPGEYYLFTTVKNTAHWSVILPSSLNIWYGRLNSMLSVTILPTVYANILNIDSIWVFKILYPLIFSFVPLCLYQIWQKYIGKKYAFISAFLFMAQQTFYIEMLGLNRQMIAELFFVLLLLVITNRKMKPISKISFFMIFSFALISSHYGLATIFLFFIFSVFILCTTLKRVRTEITVYMVVFFFVMMFLWYIYTSRSATFNSILEFGDYVYQRLGDFFNPASRGQAVMTGLGLSESPSVWNTISRFFAYFTEVLIVLGFVGLITKRVKTSLEYEFFIFELIAMALLAMLIIVPGLANTLRMSRFYHILLFFLAPLCVIGAEFIVNLFLRRKKEFAVYVLMLLVLVPYFLFQTEFVYEVVGSDSWSIALSGYRMNALRLYGQYGYPDAYGVYGAQWASKMLNGNNVTLYADERTFINVLTMYGMIPEGNSLSNTTLMTKNSFVFLSTLNVIYGKVPYEQFRFIWNVSEFSYVLDNSSMIYTNGGCEIYRYQP